MIANDPAVLALFTGQPRGFSQTHANVFEPRGGISYQLNDKTVIRASVGMFHNRVTLNDSTLLGGNVPFQPQATISNGVADNPAGVGVNPGNLPIGATAQDLVFKHPTSYMWSTSVQREIPIGFILDVTYVGRRGLYLPRERNINQLAPGTLQTNPGVNIAALRPYAGYGAIRLSENAGRSIYNSLRSRRTVATRTASSSASRTRWANRKTTAPPSAMCCGTPTTTRLLGRVQFDRRHVLAFYYIYDLPFFREQDTLMKNLLGGWQVSGATFMRSGTPFSVFQRSRDTAGVGDQGFGQPWNLVGDPGDMNYELYTGPGPRRSTRPPSLSRRRHVRQRPEKRVVQPRRAAVGSCAVQELHAWRHATHPVARRGLQLHQPPEPREHRQRRPSRSETGGSAERQLRPHHQQERSARHPAERALPVLVTRRRARSPNAARHRGRARRAGTYPQSGGAARRQSRRPFFVFPADGWRYTPAHPCFLDGIVSRRRGRTLATAALVSATATALLAQPAPKLTPPAAYTEAIPGSTVSFDMVAVPGGTFTMGSPASEAGRDADEGPQVEVTLKPFWIGKTEVTWDEYDQFAFVGNTGARTGDGGAGDSDAVSKPSRAYGDEAKGYGKGKMPALAMTQHGAMEYCRWLSQVTGKAYRLPTEAEWEYAARAGSTAALPTDIDDQAWHAGNATETPHKVGTKKPNAFGLYDMLGNVAEWTFDLYSEKRYAEWAPKATQPVALPEDKRYPHPTRGGSFIEAADKLRYANRQASHEDWSQRDPQVPQSIYWHTDADHVGFRVVRAPTNSRT